MTNHPLVKRLRRRLDPATRALLHACLDQAEARGEPLYLVGGALRDLLLRGRAAARPGLDLDLALDGDALALARGVAALTAAALTQHGRFGTATLRLHGGQLDLARTRRERYRQPGALPQVAPAPIGDDLRRRDFSVNAMALALTGPAAGALSDPFHGRDDLAARRLRILHDASFRDDPTRLIRAARYAARLNAPLTRATRRAARRDLRRLRALTAPRFGNAWRELLQDRAATGALAWAVRLGIPAAWQPGWTLPPRLLRAFDARPAAAPAPFFWALVGLTLADDRLAAALPRRCALRREERRALEGGRSLRARRARLPRLRPSAAAAVLRAQPDVATAAAAALWRGAAAHCVASYLNDWAALESPLSAAALQRAGVPPSAALGDWLARLRDAVIDGDLPRGRAGVTAARHWLQSSGAAAPARRPPRPAKRRPAKRKPAKGRARSR